MESNVRVTGDPSLLRAYSLSVSVFVRVYARTSGPIALSLPPPFYNYFTFDILVYVLPKSLLPPSLFRGGGGRGGGGGGESSGADCFLLSLNFLFFTRDRSCYRYHRYYRYYSSFFFFLFFLIYKLLYRRA